MTAILCASMLIDIMKEFYVFTFDFMSPANGFVPWLSAGRQFSIG